MKVCFSAAKTEDDVAREYAIVQANGQKLNVVTVMKEKTVLETSTYYQKYLYLLIFQLIMAVLVVVWIYLRMAIWLAYWDITPLLRGVLFGMPAIFRMPSVWRLNLPLMGWWQEFYQKK